MISEMEKELCWYEPIMAARVGLQGKKQEWLSLGYFTHCLVGSPSEEMWQLHMTGRQLVVYGVVTYISFLCSLCCREWKLPCLGMLTQEANSGGSHRGSAFKFIRLGNMFTPFISICHSVPNLVKLIHKCVEIFFPAACWVLVDEFLFYWVLVT